MTMKRTGQGDNMTNNWNEIFDYESETGKLRWKIKPSKRVRCGSIAGNNDSDGYQQVQYKRKFYRVSRIVYEMFHGKIPEEKEIGYKSKIRTDSRISNLRIATHSEHLRNGLIRRNNTSGVVGVTWNKGKRKWTAQLGVLNRIIYLGSFTSKSEAIAARLAGEQIHHGEFAQSVVFNDYGEIHEGE